MNVLVDFKKLFEQYSESLKTQINDYYDTGYTILIKVSYIWYEECISREDISFIKKWLDSKGVKYDDVLINFQTNLQEDYWSLSADIKLPE